MHVYVAFNDSNIVVEERRSEYAISIPGLVEVTGEVNDSLMHKLFTGDKSSGVVPVSGFSDKPLTTEEKSARARARRRGLISKQEQEYNTRLKEAIADNLGVALTGDALKLKQYIQALRDVPQQAGFPDVINWPEL